MSEIQRRTDVVGNDRHRWLLYTDLGVFAFVAGPLPAVAASILPDVRVVDGRPWCGWDLGFHSPKPLSDDYKPQDSCDVLEGPCYYEGSGLTGIRLFLEWADSGGDDEVIWKALLEERALHDVAAYDGAPRHFL